MRVGLLPGPSFLFCTCTRLCERVWQTLLAPTRYPSPLLSHEPKYRVFFMAYMKSPFPACLAAGGHSSGQRDIHWGGASGKPFAFLIKATDAAGLTLLDCGCDAWSCGSHFITMREETLTLLCYQTSDSVICKKLKLHLLKPLKSNVFLTDRIVTAAEVQRD